MVQRAPGGQGVLPDPAGAPAGRAHQEGEADAAAAHQEGEPTLWAIGFEGKSLLPPEGGALPAAREPRLRRRAHRAAKARRVERETTLHFHKFTSGAAGELSLKWDPVANSGSVQRARASSYYGQRRPLHISF